MAFLQKRKAQINIRAQTAQRELIDKAAAIAKKNRSDFMLEASCNAAQNLLLDRVLFLVDDKTYKAFTDMLDTPVSDNMALRSLLQSRAPWEK